MKAEIKLEILKHELVPEHEVLSASDRKAVLEKFRVTKEQLPVIMSTDPVIKQIGAKPGDVVKITRKSETAGKSVYYRCVKEA